MYFQENNKSENQINILPMIDIIFAILSFFIISSLFLTKIDSIEVNLPESSTAISEKNNPLIISINSDEQIYFEEQLITINNLSRLVKANLGDVENSLIILRADALVRHGFIINVLDELRKLKNIKIGLSTLKK
tara:strand:+ start:1359 stop:1760 length:402 start_codon:yes stop_codon:yes gene_type:complete